MDKVVHFHLPADKIERAKEFYQKLFGWEIMDTGMGKNYHLITTVVTDEKGQLGEPGAINGAMYQRESADESSVIVINVSSIDESLKNVVTLGGKVVVPKSPVGDFGLYAEISDPEGNVLGLFQDVNNE